MIFNYQEFFFASEANNNRSTQKDFHVLQNDWD